MYNGNIEQQTVATQVNVLYKYISPRWWLLLALGSITVGLVLLESMGTSGPAIGRVALLLLVYGAILIWWRLQPIVRVLELRMAWAVRRRS